MSREPVELGIVTTLPSTLIAIELAQIAEALGFDRIAFSDTAPLIYHAAYPAVTAVLMRTERIRVGPYVTNPVTRHWSIHTANARAFEDLAPGRFFLGIGTGDGAVHSVGLKPAKLAEFRIAASELRRTLPAGTPIHMAFSGPKGMAVAGELADEVTIGTGLDVPSLRNLAGLARAARQEAGITTPLKLWLPVPVHFAASADEIPALRAAWRASRPASPSAPALRARMCPSATSRRCAACSTPINSHITPRRPAIPMPACSMPMRASATMCSTVSP